MSPRLFSLFKPALFIWLAMFVCLPVCFAEVFKLGPWDERALTQLIASVQRSETPGQAIISLSKSFMGAPYVENTLHGSPEIPEELIINFSEFDCFTFLDVIEALRRSLRYEDLAENLKSVRYFDGTVTYGKRRHFFSDWVVGPTLVEDVTAQVGHGRGVTVNKQLNLKADGSLWLSGIDVTARQIDYIPTESVDEALLASLQPGDYLGIYSHLDGLDVSHTGLAAVEQGRVLLRHASSRSETRQVVDEDLLHYLQGKPGLVVYRVKP